MNSKLVAKYTLLHAPSKHEIGWQAPGGILGPGEKGRFWINPKEKFKQHRNTFLKNYVFLGEMCGSGKPASKH